MRPSEPTFSESVSRRATNAGMHNRMNTIHTMVVAKQKVNNYFLSNYVKRDSRLFGKFRKCCNQKSFQVKRQMLEHPVLRSNSGCSSVLPAVMQNQTKIIDKTHG